MIRQGFNRRRVKPVINHKLIYLIYDGDLKIGNDAPLAMVCNDDDLSFGAFDHLPNNFRLRIGRDCATVFQADPIHTDDRFVGKDLFEIIDGITARNRVGSRLVFTTNQVIKKARFAQFKCGLQIIRKYGYTRIFADLGQHLGHSRTTVNKNNITIFEQRRGQFSDTSFFFRVMLHPLLVFLFEDHTLALDRPPVCTL